MARSRLFAFDALPDEEAWVGAYELDESSQHPRTKSILLQAAAAHSRTPPAAAPTSAAAESRTPHAAESRWQPRWDASAVVVDVAQAQAAEDEAAVPSSPRRLRFVNPKPRHMRMFFPSIHAYFMCGNQIGKSSNAAIYDAVPIGALPDSITSVDLVLRIPHSGRPAHLDSWRMVMSRLASNHSHHIFAPIDIDPVTPALVMPKAHGDLFNFIYRKQIPNIHQRYVAASHICRAVHDIHRLGVAHRDIKPENIFLTRLGFYALADLEFATDHTRVPLTHFAGTPRYAHPVLYGIIKKHGCTACPPSLRQERIYASAKDGMDGVIWEESTFSGLVVNHEFAHHEMMLPVHCEIGTYMREAEGVYEVPIAYDPFVADMYATLISLIETLLQDEDWANESTKPVAYHHIDAALVEIANTVDMQLGLAMQMFRFKPSIDNLRRIYVTILDLAHREGSGL